MRTRLKLLISVILTIFVVASVSSIAMADGPALRGSGSTDNYTWKLWKEDKYCQLDFVFTADQHPFTLNIDQYEDLIKEVDRRVYIYVDVTALSEDDYLDIEYSGECTIKGVSIYSEKNYDFKFIEIDVPSATKLYLQTGMRYKYISVSAGVTSYDFLEEAVIDGISLGSYEVTETNTASSLTVPGTIKRLDVEDDCISEITIKSPDTEFYISSNSVSKVNLPAGITSLEYTFYRCPNLKSIDLPESLTTIGSRAFYSCGFETFTVPYKVTSIGKNAFEKCSSLESITIPASVKSIGVSAINGCSSLKDVYFAGTAEQWHKIAITPNYPWETTDKTIDDVFKGINVHFAQTQSGWVKSGDFWTFYDGHGNLVKNDWLNDYGKWYYFNADGYMVTGWQQVAGKWYYFENTGIMVTGWKQIGGKWYCFESSGAMATGWLKSGSSWYYLTPGNGDMVTGWRQIGGKWYFFNGGGDMVTGWKQIGGKWYFFNSNGDMATGWVSTGGKWYYFNAGGDMATGWLNQGGSWYYLKSSGEMATGIVEIDGRKSEFANSGVWLGYVS